MCVEIDTRKQRLNVLFIHFMRWKCVTEQPASADYKSIYHIGIIIIVGEQFSVFIGFS